VTKLRVVLFAVVALAILAIVRFVPLEAEAKAKAAPAPSWIWADETRSNQTVFFRKEVGLEYRVTSARLYGTCDNHMTVYINGKEVITSDNWDSPVFREVTDAFINPTVVGQPVKNVIAVKAHNTDGPAGLLVKIVLQNSKKQTITIVTDGTWQTTDKPEDAGWKTADFTPNNWRPATVVGKLGAAPWVQVTEAALQGTAKFKKPTATPIELIKVKKDFKVELLYSVPKATQGSWVSMTVDNKGRLITSDQYGKLYRIFPPAIGKKPEDTKVQELPVELGEAHGLCWAFDALYVVVNEGRKYKPRGLWRVTSTNDEDLLDKKELLREIEGNGEHGPHAVVPGPDGKSLYVVHGNHTKPVKTSRTTVPPIWGEDFLTPRLWDASGHAVGIMAPAGCIYKTDKDGKDWTLISMGYRNQYDIAFNRDGELFTYDSDMEWDMNLPWYRPTRICHAVPGSEFGWRGGTGKMYEYHPDNLPPVVNVGPGSPTGIVFGYGAKFPAKYEEALFCCDWSYGKLYACHLTPDGATYKGELEEFLTGSPLPLTDLIVNPKDGALYFTIGGRTTMSGLYRVTYTGKLTNEPKEGGPKMAYPARDARRKLESYYGKNDPDAINEAWLHLSSEDRFLRYAARTVLEFQKPNGWMKKALDEKHPVALTQAMIALARVSGPMARDHLLEALERIDWPNLTVVQKIDCLRAYQLAFIRGGMPGAEWKDRAGKRIDAWYPDKSRDVNAELCKLICHLEVPGGVAKTLALLAKAPTQEEQIEYALSLRSVKTGWTLKQREDFLNWFHKAANYRGGNSFHGFLRNIRTDTIKSLSLNENRALFDVISSVPTPASPKFKFKQRPLVQKYTADELTQIVEKGLTGRDFDKGRNLFGEAKCFACHRFNSEGGGTGPDLTIISGRFGTRDLMEKVINPSKNISDQYAAIVVTTTDGRQIVGRVVNLAGDGMIINTDMLDPNKLVNVNRNLVESITPSKISMMPEGLLDGFEREEILDLVAYLYSRGDRNHKMFRK